MPSRWSGVPNSASNRSRSKRRPSSSGRASAAATAAFAAWLDDERSDLGRQLHRAFDELAGGFPGLAE